MAVTMTKRVVRIGILGVLIGSCTDAGSDRVLGISGEGRVAGTTYFDGNATRELDAGDTALEGVRVALVAAGSRDTVEKASSDRNGRFAFAQVPIGDYEIVVDPTTIGDTAIVARIDTSDVQVSPNDTIEVAVAISFGLLTIQEVKAMAIGSRVFVDGIALNAPGTFGDSTIHLADTSGSLRAIRSGPAAIAAGDSVRLRGALASRNGQLVLNLDRRVPQLLAIAELPAPDTLTTAAAASAQSGTLDAAFVRIDSARVTDTLTVSGDFQVTIDDGSGPLKLIIDESVPFVPSVFLIPGGDVMVNGLLVATGLGEWVMKPRFQQDVKVDPPVVPIAAARAVGVGEIVFVDGVALHGVTLFGDSVLHVADTSGAIRATGLRRTNLFRGDSLRLVGRTRVQDGQPVLENVTVFTLGFGTVPAPRTVTTGEAAAADGGRLDAGLVRIDSARVTDTTTVDGDFVVTIDDGSGPATVVLDGTVFPAHDQFLVPGAALDVDGLLVARGTGDWIVRPRSPLDLDVIAPVVSIAAAKLAAAGSTVFVDGVALHGVALFGDSTLHVADTSGGILAVGIRQTNLFEGDSVRLIARIGDLNGRVVLQDPAAFRIGQGTVPAPVVVTSGDAASARGSVLDARLVRVESASITDTATVGGEFTFDVDDGSGVVTVVFDANIAFADPAPLVPTTVVNVTGILSRVSDGSWQLKPRRNGDVVIP